ncbi:NAD(P)-binding protein [Myriangium duriaei CBS 260.36]|uniref:NAD(P)-binding protein n=1 Tax=Myriangium duriaei CBS 260.36 TaxID=1168546 RepID=A0A9P4IUF1_9PEZI|nr:NAD(P)-binding protein [Myriangium duriaei CBS 260.36]
MGYLGGALPELYSSYDFISPQKYATKLNGKVTIVTGVSSGIGRATAKAFAAAGASVALVARREAQLKSLAEEIIASGGHAIAVPADVTAKGAAASIVSKVESQLGPVDILVNNAGRARLGPLIAEDQDLDIWWNVYELNVKAPVSLIRAVLPSMEKRKTGTLITVSSAVATMRLPVMAGYASSKAAISKVHESLVPELEGTGIFSVALSPGMVQTELGSADEGLNKKAMDHPAMKAFFSHLSGTRQFQDEQLPADFIVALAAEPRARVLHGKHVDAVQDLEAVITEAEKDGEGRIGNEKLYQVNIGVL